MTNNNSLGIKKLLLVILFCIFAPLPSHADNLIKKSPIRAFHFVLKDMEMAKAIQLVELARKAGFNTAVVALSWGVELDHSPWTAKSNAWTKNQLLSWVNYARQHGMAVIPEIKLLSHQYNFFQGNHSDLMFNSDTYDPANELVYKKVFALLDEVIATFDPPAIHIGHDEIVGWLLKRKVFPNKAMGLKQGEQALPAELFLMDVLRIHGYLKQRGVETWMWGDMLISPEEFPEMRAWELHGGHVGNYGYGKPLRNQLPRDIVICDWHYFDDQAAFPSLRAFKQEGFRVLGATWKKEKTIRNFSRYAAEHGAEGMIATTWFHVQRKEWDVVEKIIRESGEAFNKDFPDAQ